MKELKINGDIWNDVPVKDKTKIENILKKEGLIATEDKITAELELENESALSRPICKAACNVAFQSAKAACLLLENPIAIAACITAAEEARKLCKDRC